MRFLPGRWRAACAVLGFCAALGAAVASAAEEAPPRGWYVSAAAGMSWKFGMEQEGWNRDNICYPNNDCSGGLPEGYRWFYDLDAARGVALEIAFGHAWEKMRLELSLAEHRQDVAQEFASITYLDGSAIVPARDAKYAESAAASADKLTTRTLALNLYRDFPISGSRLTPYLGAGLGISFVKLSGLYYRSTYSCARDCGAGPAENFNSEQEVDLSDTVLSKHLHAGADYRLSDRLLVGLKLSYSMVDDMEEESGYSRHPIPDGTNRTRISGMDRWSLTLGLKYFFRD